MRRHQRLLAVLFAVLAVAGGALTYAQAPSPPGLDGTWRGTVVSEMGELEIEVTLEVTGGKASGSIRSGHGEFKVKDGGFADGKWTLPFSGDGFQGRLAAVLKGDSLSGDWINPGVTTGTFELVRSK